MKKKREAQRSSPMTEVLRNESRALNPVPLFTFFFFYFLFFIIISLETAPHHSSVGVQISFFCSRPNS